MTHTHVRPHAHHTRARYEDLSTRPPVRPPHAEIARLAYLYWEARGRQHGSALEDWLRAERELYARRR